MDEKVDTGDMIVSLPTSIFDSDSSFELYKRSISTAKRAFFQFMTQLKDSCLERESYADDGKFYKRSDLNFLKKQNMSSIDYDIVKASYFPGYPPSFTVVNGKMVHLLPENASLDDQPFYNLSDWEKI